MKLVSISKRLARLLTPSRTGAALLAVPLLAAALPTAGCGKEDNLHEVVVLDFPHSFPEAPRPLDAARSTPERTGHPLVATDTHLFVLDRDNRELVRLDRDALDTAKSRTTPGPEREASLRLGGRPEQLVALDSGDFLITLRTTGEVLRVTANLEITQRVRLGVDAYGIALSPDGRTAYVTLPMNGELVTLDALTLEELDRAALLDTPRGVTASTSNFLLVTQQHGPATRIEVDESGLPLGVINLDLRRGSPAELISMNRLHVLQANRALAVTTHPHTGAAYVAHVAAAPGNPEQVVNNGPVAPGDAPASSDGYGGGSLGGGAFNVPTRPLEVAVTPTDPTAVFPTLEADFPVQDPKTGEPMTHLVDQPSDIAHHPTWSLLFMTGYGTDNVLVMSTSEADPMRSPIALIDVGRAPRGIAFSPDGQLAYVLNEHDLTISVIELARFFDLEPLANGKTVFPTTATDAPVPTSMGGFASEPGGRMEFFSSDPTPDSPRVAPFRMSARAHVAYGHDPMPEAVRRGARTFTFSRNESISHAGQFACASCHFEGTEDKLVWVISDGPRQTPALAGRLAGTAPFNWAGSEAELQHNMVQTVDRMGGAGLSATELADLEQFLLFGLEAPPNPYRSPDNQLTADQLAGKAIFESKEAACSSCHMPEREFTDGRSHDVGTASKAELVSHEFARAVDPEARPPWVLDTPSLKGLFYTAPYFHDGSAPTLLDVLDRPGSSMGKTSHLTADQKRQLIAYLLTL